MEWYKNLSLVQRRKLGLSLIISAFFIIFLHNQLTVGKVIKTAAQVKFENYADRLNRQFFKNEQVRLPSISLVVLDNFGNKVKQIVVEPSPETGEKVVRILSLIKESEVFGLNNISPGSQRIATLIIEGDEGEYSASFKIDGNNKSSQIELLLKLLSIYGKVIV